MRFTSSEAFLGMRGRIWDEFAKNTYHSDNVRGKRSRQHAHGLHRLWKPPETTMPMRRPWWQAARAMRHGAREAKKLPAWRPRSLEDADELIVAESPSSGVVPESVNAQLSAAA